MSTELSPASPSIPWVPTLSIAIPTYNGAQRFPDVLEALPRQVIPPGLQWEVLIIDNNSQDDTAAIAAHYQSQWRYHWPEAPPLRYCFEPTQGLTFARRCAITQARGTWVGFLDDDNLPHLDWLTETWAFLQAHPHIGAVGGKIQGLFAELPPPYLEEVSLFLALVDRGPRPRLYTPAQRMLPPGAGLVVRREAWQAHVPPVQVLRGRVFGSMVAGEDLEALAHIQQGGWEIWYNPAMVIQHKIPSERLTPEYLFSLVGGAGLCRHHLRWIRRNCTALGQALVVTPLHFGRDLWHWLHYFLRHYRPGQPLAIPQRLELHYRWTTLISPFFMATLYWQGWRQGRQGKEGYRTGL